MSRMHIHIAVEDLAANTRFYSAMFGSEPTVTKSDYVKWELADPAVNFAISSRGNPPGIEHLGIQAGNDEELAALRKRVEAADISGVEEQGIACCYARSDKYWLQDPQGIPWETFHTLDTVPTFNEEASKEGETACCTPAVTESKDCCG